MYEPLVPCPSCARHVRTTEVVCPFCSAALPDDLASRVIPGASKRMSRAAVFLVGASLSVTSCSGEVTTQTSAAAASGGQGGGGGAGGGGGFGGGPEDDGGAQPLYGGPPLMDAGTDAPAFMDAAPDAPPEDDGGVQPLYGAAPSPPEE